MPSADQVPVNNTHLIAMRWHKWVVLIAGSTGTALRAVRPPNLHITPGAPARSRSPRKSDGFFVAFALGHHSPGHPRNFVRKCDGSDLYRLPRQQRREPGPMLGAMDFGIADDGECSRHEQAAKIAIALFADAAEPLLAPTRVLFGNEPNPGGEVTSGPEGSGIGNTRNQRSGQHRTDPRNVMKALTRLVGPMPGQDHPIKLQNLLLESEQLSTERGKAGTGNLRHPLVARVGNNMQQFRDPSTPDRRDNAELGKVSSDRVNHRGLLADEQMAGAVKHQAALLLRCLCWHEAHVGSGARFANSLCVSHVVLLPFDVGLQDRKSTRLNSS